MTGLLSPFSPPLSPCFGDKTLVGSEKGWVSFRVGKRLTPFQLETLFVDKFTCIKNGEGFGGALKGL